MNRGKLDSLLVAQQTTSAQIVGWQFIPFGVDQPDKATVSIFRSAVENADFELIGKVPAERGWFEDDGADLTNRWEIPFYKLILDVDGTKTTYGPVRIDGEKDQVSLGLIRHTNTYLKLAGIPVLVYQYLNSGDRCLTCWDPVFSKTTISNCETCFGTGFERGYHAPVLTLGAMGVEGKQNTVNERIEQNTSIEMMFSNYPFLRPGDLIYEIDAGKRYKVQQVLPAEKHRVLVNQAATGVALQTTDVEHELPIPKISELTPVLRRKKAPHRKVSSTDGESFNNSKFEYINY